MKLNIIFQDNASVIKLIENGKDSSCKRTHHFNARLFHTTDLIAANEVTVKHCRTEKILANHMPKPLVGTALKVFRDSIINLNGKHDSQVRQ